jgi:hypothetical protein
MAQKALLGFGAASLNRPDQKTPYFFTQSKVDAALIESLEEIFDETCKWLIL